MMSCWKNDPDARPTFSELKNQLKDMETLHKVRILIYMKVLFSLNRLTQAQLIVVLNLSALSVNGVVIRTHLGKFYEVWIPSSCCVTVASTPRKTEKKQNWMTIDTLWLFKRS